MAETWDALNALDRQQRRDDHGCLIIALIAWPLRRLLAPPDDRVADRDGL
jgi:hypothetical protein